MTKLTQPMEGTQETAIMSERERQKAEWAARTRPSPYSKHFGAVGVLLNGVYLYVAHSVRLWREGERKEATKAVLIALGMLLLAGGLLYGVCLLVMREGNQ
jgi:hypothetical protein